MAHRQIEALLTAYPTTERRLIDPQENPPAVTGQAKVTLLHQSPPAPGAVLDGRAARQRADFLADAALACIARSQPDLLLLVGGDTAVTVLSRLDVERLTVESELLPGMPLCTADVNGHSLRVVMKPGSFGDEQALVEALEHSSVGALKRRNV